MSYTTEHLLASEKLSLKYDTPTQRGHDDEEFWKEEKERIDYDRCTAYFERDRDDYIRGDDRGYSNPISL